MNNNAEDILLVSEVVLFGSRKAFERLVDKYQVPVRNFFMLHTGYDRMSSEDLSQETFIRCWERLGTFKGISSFRTWLYSVAFNILQDYYRNLNSRARLNEHMDVSDNACADEMELVDSRHDTLSALKILSNTERSCVILYYMNGIKVSEIARISGIPAGTVKSHLSRARDKMQKYLKEDGYGE